MGFGSGGFGSVPFGSTLVEVVAAALTAFNSVTHVVGVFEVTHDVSETAVTRQIITHSVTHIVGDTDGT